jgi:outer membrane protein insertion porin family
MSKILYIAGLFLILSLPFRLKGAFSLEVEGLGWRTEKRLERLLDDVLRDPDQPDAGLDATKAEDAILLLRSELNRVGFLSPTIEYRLFLGANELGRAEWSPKGDLSAIPWAQGDRALFVVRRGERAFFDRVEFVGLSVLPEEEARSFFYPSAGLFVSERHRAYSPGALEAGLRSLRQRLAQLGYLEAAVTVAKPVEIAPTGEVGVVLTVEPNARYIWSAAFVEGAASEGLAGDLARPEEGSVFTEDSLQDWISSVRSRHFAAGYPDVRLSVRREFVEIDAPAEEGVAVTLRLEPGPRVRQGPIRFQGREQTNATFLRDYLDLGEASWLNLIELDSAQFALGRLGIFRRIRYALEDVPGVDTPTRAVNFLLEERERFEVSALVGYGSFEQVRIGMEARALNLWGRAHSGQLRLRASLRGLAGLALYSVPFPVSWLELGQVRLQGLQRDEISFRREEALLALGVSRGFAGGTLRTSAEYRFELLRSVDLISEELIGDTRATVGSLLLGFSWDTRDRVVSPRRGGSLQSQLELASPALGSEANFQRFVLRGSWHYPMKQDRLRWHFGLEGGFLARMGADAAELPVNKRFFPGGENSLRGFQDGEASPLDADGDAIGAEAYALGHAELEVWLLESLGLVVFTDGLWASASFSDTSDSDTLFSAGLGLRYNTPLGPLRMEYGHNLNPRPTDPDGTLHLSIGFPF